jgi:threonylcarbamoyladenosine tRNA methylthiotransferase MtaB
MKARAGLGFDRATRSRRKDQGGDLADAAGVDLALRSFALDPGPSTFYRGLDPMNFFIFTTGCKANQWDSHVIAARLRDAGHLRTRVEDADLVIVNACSLTNRAETDARRFIQKARQLNGAIRVALVGCHAQAYPDRAFGADLILGQQEKFETDRYVTDRGRFVEKTRDFPMEAAPAGRAQRGRTRFFFKVQDGCNKFCSYCVVPYTRGAPRSRPVEEIAAAMRDLREKNVKEVVLTGIDMAAYRDPSSGRDLLGLLQLLDAADAPPRIRLSSIDPEYVDDRFVSLLARSVRLAPSIHLPLQSGSNSILQRMGRRHGPGFIREVIEKLKAAVPAIGIGMDVMVGFPGEDGAAFEETYRFIEEASIYYLHVFPYSPREGTRAATMDNQVTEGTKRERVRRLKVLDGQKREAFAHRFVGERLTIIPEGKIEGNGLMKGFSENYLPIYLPFEKRLENNLVEVTIRGLENGRLIGG